MRLYLLLCLLASAATMATGQSITRGPYLNIGTTESVIIRWRTDSPVVGKVVFGTAENSQNLSSAENSVTTEHEVKISGLNPATKYYYTLTDANSSTYQGNDSDRYFQTSPEVGSREPITIWALGDFGNGSAGQLGVRNGFESHTNNQHTDVWIWLGDNAYGDGTDAEYQSKVFEVYPDQLKNTVVWPCPGNHDYGSIDLLNNGPYYDIFSLPENGEAGGEPSGEEGYYSFDYGNVHFVSLNSEYIVWFLTSSSQMVEWLRDDLEQNTLDFTIVYWHKPPYSKGSHDSDTETYMALMRSVINPVIEEYNVDLVLTGHSHGYERSYLLNGHHGQSNSFNWSMAPDTTKGSPIPYLKQLDAATPNQGTVYATVGCGGQLSTSGDLNHPAMYYSTNNWHGSMVITVDSLLLTARFIDTMGTVRDEFMIQKTLPQDTTVDAGNLRSLDDYVRIYPNPAQTELTMALRSEKPVFFLAELYDLNGHIVATRHVKVNGTHQEKIDVSHLPQGNYLLSIRQNGAEKLVKKVMVLR